MAINFFISFVITNFFAIPCNNIIACFQFLDHQFPHGRDVPSQVDRLRHSLHGGDRQGDLRDEALRQLQVKSTSIAIQWRLENQTGHVC